MNPQLPAYSGSTLDQPAEGVLDEDLSIIFRCRLSIPWQEQQVVYVEFSACNNFLIVLCPWREPTAQSTERKKHDILAYDLETRDFLRLGALSSAMLGGYYVGARGAAIGPAATAQNDKLGGLLRSKPSRVLPLAICHNPIIQGSKALDSTPRIDIVDLYKLKRKRYSSTIQIQGPLAWSPDGSLLAGLHFGDPTKVSLFQPQMDGIPRMACLPGHLADITQLAFMPDSKSILSLASDGVGRLVSTSPTSPGRLLKSFRVPSSSRYPASILQISSDGSRVASVWGRLVVLWHPESGLLESYELESARPDADLFPLAISPDCHLLACRSDTGVEVCDLLTGRRRGGATWKGGGTGFATAAGFSGGTGMMLAVGMFNGGVTVYNVLDEGEEPPVELETHEQPVEVQAVPIRPFEVSG